MSATTTKIATTRMTRTLRTAVRNRLVSLRNRAESAWSQVSVQLRRRRDNIGNQVEAATANACPAR